MLEIESLPDKKSTKVLFSGDLSVSQSAELQQQLLNTGEETPNIEIHVNRVDNMDLSFLQLLYSWARGMKKSGKNLIFDFRLGEEFQRIYEQSGFKEAFARL